MVVGPESMPYCTDYVHVCQHAGFDGALAQQKAIGLDDEVLNCAVLPCCSLTVVLFTAEKQRDGMSHTLVQMQCFLPLTVPHILCPEGSRPMLIMFKMK